MASNNKKILEVKYEKNSESIIIPLAVIGAGILIALSLFLTFVIIK